MNRIVSYFLAFLGVAGVHRRIRYLDQKLDVLQRRHTFANEILANHTTRLETIKAEFDQSVAAAVKRFNKQHEAAEIDLRNAVKLSQDQEEALQATREQLKTAEEITIPALVESHMVIIKRWEAETAVHVARQTMVNTRERDAV